MRWELPFSAELVFRIKESTQQEMSPLDLFVCLLLFFSCFFLVLAVCFYVYLFVVVFFVFWFFFSTLLKAADLSWGRRTAD